MLEYIPYIKYVIAAGTRFERDKRVLFDPNGEVAQGKQLSNYGWASTGLKEFVKALYESKRKNLTDFENFYGGRILDTDENIVDVLKRNGLIEEVLPALLVITIREGIEVPALLVNVDKILFKRCLQCGQSWRNNPPPAEFTTFLAQLGVERITRVFQCSRQLCKFICDHYKYCEKSYTSTEGLSDVEDEKLECLKSLLMLIAGRISQVQRYECIQKERIPDKPVFKKTSLEIPLNFRNFKDLVNTWEEINLKTCIERPLRFYFTPLRYFFFDHKTWWEMQRQRYCKTPGQRNIDALPVLRKKKIAFGFYKLPQQVLRWNSADRTG